MHRKKYWALLLVLFSFLLLVSCTSTQTQTKDEKGTKNDSQKTDTNNKGTAPGRPVVIEFMADW